MGGIGIYGPRSGGSGAPPTPTPTTFTGGFDYVIASRADLVTVVAPVAGVFTLPSGAYALRGNISLNGGERIAIPAGGVVTLFGNADRGIIGTPAAPAALVTNDGFLNLINVYAYNLGTPSPALRINAGSVYMQAATVFADGIATDAVEMVGSGVILKADQSFMSGTRSGLHMIGGRAYACACDISSGSDGPDGAAIRQTGGILLKRFFGTDCEFLQTGTNPAVHMNSLLGNVDLENCLLAFTQDDVPAVVLAECKSLVLGAGTVLTHQGGGTKVGVRIQGNVNAIDLDHCQFEGFTFGMEYVSGLVIRAKVIGVDQNVGPALVDWPAANIPADGLLIVGCSSQGAPLSGAFATDPRVNLKANTQAGALASETPIVP